MENVIRLTFKDPDGVYESVRQFVIDNLPKDLDEDEKDSIQDMRISKVQDKLSKWVEYGEYLTVEINLDTGEAKVIQKGR